MIEVRTTLWVYMFVPRRFDGHWAAFECSEQLLMRGSNGAVHTGATQQRSLCLRSTWEDQALIRYAPSSFAFSHVSLFICLPQRTHPRTHTLSRTQPGSSLGSSVYCVFPF